ncbi:50S ribosomal protein L3 [Candidatus Beckwithbacteria bacterium RBG_13_35_6]|uniref:50S ribosomal protein L3 n=1 Tax=Candidatus Beckwithbacteria bacterium RBG_13_35_6 TaxID=1797456 RepID=A0A1F5DFM9_9BACT|nr:MAG: 50S ribosomal protein L3 [Candidatus Beckwithbacteria bacterium RBG_13_35_6]
MDVNSFFGYKIKQTQDFDQKGLKKTFTIIKAEPLVIKRIKVKDKDGYWAYLVEVGKGLKKRKKTLLREIKLDKEPSLKIKDQLQIADVFKVGDVLQVTGITKGKGFAGVVKRWGFKGGPKTHGQSDRERAPGSIGQGTSPGKVWKGKKMPGRMGGKTKTIKGLKVYKVESDKNELWITGLVPGGRGGLIKISKLS